MSSSSSSTATAAHHNHRYTAASRRRHQLARSQWHLDKKSSVNTPAANAALDDKSRFSAAVQHASSYHNEKKYFGKTYTSRHSRSLFHFIAIS